MRHYSIKVRVAAGVIIVFECLILIIGLSYYYYSKYASRVLGVSVARINKENIDAHVERNLEHYYEWSANQSIIYKSRWLHQTVTKYTNDDGILGQKNYDLIKPKGVFRILTIGDSFTEGMYVALDETYPKKLETLLNRLRPCASILQYEVINLGVGGYDIEYSAARFHSKGLKYNPDLVIWLLKDDDFIERAEVNFSREAQYTEYVQNTLGGDIKKFDQYQKWVDVLNYDEGLESLVHRIVVKEDIEKSSHKYYLSEQDSAVKSVAELLGTPLILTTFSDTKPEFKARMKVWANEYPNIKFFSDIPVLKPGVETFEPDDGHPNTTGHTVLSESIYQHVLGADACRRVSPL